MWKQHPTHTHIETHPDGLIRNTRTKRLLKGWVNAKGYTRVYVEGRSLRLHRLVLETFVPCPDPSMHAGHKDHDKSNNRLDNLEWITAYENNHQNIARGFNPGILTPDQAREFWALREAGMSTTKLDRLFGRPKGWAALAVRKGCYRRLLAQG